MLLFIIIIFYGKRIFPITFIVMQKKIKNIKVKLKKKLKPNKK